MKPSYARILADDVISVSPSVNTVGYFTQDLTGARFVAPVLIDDWRTLPTPQERPTLGVPDGPYLDQASDVGLRTSESHIDCLRAAGYAGERVTVMEDIAAINDRHEQLMDAEMAVVHEPWFREYAEVTRLLIETGRHGAVIARVR